MFPVITYVNMNPGGRSAVVLSGGNIDRALFARILSAGWS